MSENAITLAPSLARCDSQRVERSRLCQPLSNMMEAQRAEKKAVRRAGLRFYERGTGLVFFA